MGRELEEGQRRRSQKFWHTGTTESHEQNWWRISVLRTEIYEDASLPMPLGRAPHDDDDLLWDIMSRCC